MNLSRRLYLTLVTLPFGLAVAFMAPNAYAAPKEVRYKEIPLEIKSGDRILISGIRGTIRLNGESQGPAVLRASKTLADKAGTEAAERFEALSFSMKRDGSTITIEAKGPDTKIGWGAWLKSNTNPELVLELKTPAVPIEVSLHEGLIAVQNWNESIAASVVSGTIKTVKTEGNLRAQAQRGEVRIESHKGPAEVDSFGAKLTVQEMEGALDLTNFGGETSLARVQGRVQMLSHAGASSISKSSGSLEFANGRGALNLSEFDGPVRGRTELGSVVVGVEGEAEVDVDSDKGNVAVRLPANSGASLRLHTEDGGIVAPEDIRMTTSSTHRAAVGRLPGDGPKGIVAVRSKTGAIRVR